jgi:acetyl esterase
VHDREDSVIDRLGRLAARAALAAPGPVLRAVAGGAVTREGLVLDPQLAATLAAAHRVGVPSPEQLPLPRARAYASRMLRMFDVAPRPMAQVIDAHAPGPDGPVPVRIYRPRAAMPAMIVYLHGGGGVIGSIADSDGFARLLADETRCLVASVEYRLAPEAPYPAAVDDALAAWRWARDAAPGLGVDPARVALAGDSMGGFLAATVERRDRTAPRPAALGLVYPLVDLTTSSPSYDTFAEGFLLSRPLIRWFLDHFCPDHAARRAASLLYSDDLHGVPPTLVVTAGFDPLRDEGRAWAARLTAAGARATLREHTSLIHGFISMTGAIRAAHDATLELCADLRELLG